LLFVLVGVCLADKEDDENRYHSILRSCSVENWDDTMEMSDNFKNIGECIECYTELPQDDPSAWLQGAMACGERFLPKEYAACAAELNQFSAENFQEQARIVSKCFGQTRLELVAERCLKLTKGNDVIEFAGDHAMCMMNTRLNITNGVRSIEAAEERHEAHSMALYYTTDEYKSTQLYIRDKLFPIMYCDAAIGDNSRKLKACYQCFKGVEGESQEAIEAAIKCSRDHLLDYYQECHDMLTSLREDDAAGNGMVRMCYLRGIYRHVARKCNPKQPRLNSMTMVRNLKCGYMVFQRLVEEKAPEMAEQIMKTIQSDYSGLEIWNRQ